MRVPVFWNKLLPRVSAAFRAWDPAVPRHESGSILRTRLRGGLPGRPQRRGRHWVRAFVVADQEPREGAPAATDPRQKGGPDLRRYHVPGRREQLDPFRRRGGVEQVRVAAQAQDRGSAAEAQRLPPGHEGAQARGVDQRGQLRFGTDGAGARGCGVRGRRGQEAVPRRLRDEGHLHVDPVPRRPLQGPVRRRGAAVRGGRAGVPAGRHLLLPAVRRQAQEHLLVGGRGGPVRRALRRGPLLPRAGPAS
mmetsp:Transcript_44331/g.118292  ORF Transcript_44331/g.118292 Transcript_44331/m.118292 type:complete len:249 (+) Transcript_44331:458-1204(+)